MTAWDIISNIPAGAPIWVWPLLLWMIWEGVSAMRNRSVAIWVYWMLPFFALISVRGRLEAAAPEVDLPVYAAAYALGLAFGHRFQGGVLIERTAKQVAVKGEPLTLVMLMTIFWMNFVSGVIKAISPDLMESYLTIAILAAISGAVSGQFAGRALRVLRAPQGVFRRSDPQVQPVHSPGSTL